MRQFMRLEYEKKSYAKLLKYLWSSTYVSRMEHILLLFVVIVERDNNHFFSLITASIAHHKKNIPVDIKFIKIL